MKCFRGLVFYEGCLMELVFSGALNGVRFLVECLIDLIFD